MKRQPKQVAAIAAAAVIATLALIAFWAGQREHTTAAAPSVKLLEEDSKLLRFVYTHLIDEDGGVFTNYRTDYPEADGFARNHDKLSESTGLLMQYAVERERRDIFEQQLYFLKQRLLHKSGLVRWVWQDGKRPININASIDDLRIVKSLLSGAKRWEQAEYRKLAEKIAGALYDQNRVGDVLDDSYDADAKYASGFVTSSYLDLATMRMLMEIDPKWALVADRSEALLKEAYQENGFFWKTYSITNRQWDEIDRFNLIDVLIPAAYLVEAGHDATPTVSFLEMAWERDGALFSNYDSSQVALDDVESPAVYALAVRFLEETDRYELADALRGRLLEMAVQTDYPAFEGGYIWVETLECYSFDQLTTMLVQ